MAGISDLLGANGVIEQLLLWNVVGQVMQAMMSPAFLNLQQDALARHPDMVITPEALARAVVQTFMGHDAAVKEAAKSGIDASRFDVLLKLADVRLSPADLAEAVLRSYLDQGAAKLEAREQGITGNRFDTLTLLAGDGIGPQQAAQARRRGLIKAHGKGPDSTSFDQAIAESRLHNKWGEVLFELERALLSPADAASAVVRGFLAHAEGASLAALSGVDAATFTTMVELAGDAPSPTQLAVALRRGIIPRDSGSPSEPGFVQGIEQGRLANKWTHMIEALAQEWPTPTDALQSRLVGQTTTEEAKELYVRFGGDPQYFDLLFRTRGEAPTPIELGILANRGDIKWEGLGPEETTFAQGFHEGRWRNKWQAVYRKLAVFHPPAGTVVTALAHGLIDDAQAAKYLTELGMDEAAVKMHLGEAHLEAYSALRGGNITLVVDAYYEHLLTHAEAKEALEGFHVTPTAADMMLELVDNKRAFAAVNNALSRVRTLYASRKITVETARDALKQLGVNGTSINEVIAAWQIENSVSVKTLTAAQITDAWFITAITEDEALTELENIGYSPFDAWVLLSIKGKALQRGKPAQGPAKKQGQVTPGTT